MPKIDVRRFNLRPAMEYDPMFDDPEDGIMDKGPWTVDVWPDRDGGRPSIVLQSDDFTFDAALEISGDFASHEQKLKYAHFIADQLNSRR